MHTPFLLYGAFNISIIQESLGQVQKNLRTLLSDRPFSKTVLNSISFSRVCRTKSIPYNPRRTKFLLYEPKTNPGTTVFFVNQVDGWHTLVYNYSRLFHKNVFQVGFNQDPADEQPAYFFDYFYYHKKKFCNRHIHAIKGEKWIFFADGEIQPFEDKRNYGRKQVKDRLNNEVIINYLKKGGYDLSNTDFFESYKKGLYFTDKF